MCSRCFLQLLSYILCLIRELTAERSNIMRGERREDRHSISKISNRKCVIWLMYMEKTYVSQWPGPKHHKVRVSRWQKHKLEQHDRGTTGRNKPGGKYWLWIHLRRSSANRAQSLTWITLSDKSVQARYFTRGTSGWYDIYEGLFRHLAPRENEYCSPNDSDVKHSSQRSTSTSSPTVSKHCFKR